MSEATREDLFYFLNELHNECGGHNSMSMVWRGGEEIRLEFRAGFDVTSKFAEELAKCVQKRHKTK